MDDSQKPDPLVTGPWLYNLKKKKKETRSVGFSPSSPFLQGLILRGLNSSTPLSHGFYPWSIFVEVSGVICV